MSGSGNPAARRKFKAALAHLPIALYSSVMGILGLGLAWRMAASTIQELTGVIGEAIVVLGLCVYVALFASYGLKVLWHPAAVRAEFKHRESVNFFPTFSIGTMLVASGVLPHAPQVAHVLWSIGASLTLVLTLVIFRRWLTQHNEVHHVNPTWFLAVVGNIVAPIAAVPLGHDELGWMFFGAGIMFWIPMLTIVLYRMIFHSMLPARLLPTLVIMIGPPAVGFVAYTALAGEIDAFAKFLFYAALFLTLLIGSIAHVFIRIPFSPSWWAFTFPLDALAIAALHYGAEFDALALGAAAVVALVVATAVVTFVSVCTVLALTRGDLFKPSSESDIAAGSSSPGAVP